MGMSDEIEEFIKELFGESNSHVEIKRNELAERFRVAPSQINYVISTRFKPDYGYYVESRRGGGGFIKIKRASIINDNYMENVVNEIGDRVSSFDVDIIISDFLTYDLISKQEAKLLKVATSDNVLKLDAPLKDEVRARILKNMIINLDEK